MYTNLNEFLCINRVDVNSSKRGLLDAMKRGTARYAAGGRAPKQFCGFMIIAQQKSYRNFSTYSQSKGVWLDQRLSRSQERLARQLNPPPALEHVKVVLTSPKHPSNIGAVARVCENFECFRLAIVDPRCDVYCDEVLKVACGSAVLESLEVFDTIQDSLQDMNAAIAFTRRAGSTRPVSPRIHQLLQDFPALLNLPFKKVTEPDQRASTYKGGTALVFGREESGLTADELAACTHLCAIPTGRTQPSMNLSHAAAAVLAQWYEHVQISAVQDSTARTQQNWKQQAASLAEVEALMARVRRLAKSAGLTPEAIVGGKNHARKFTEVGQMQSVLERAGVTIAEVRALHTYFRALEESRESSDDQLC